MIVASSTAVGVRSTRPSIAQCRIERAPADREHRNEPFQPFRRHEIEQRRRGDEVGVLGERGPRSSARSTWTVVTSRVAGVVSAAASSSADIVVDQTPVLTRPASSGATARMVEPVPQPRSATRTAGRAGERRPHRVEHGGIARRLVVGLAQRRAIAEKKLMRRLEHAQEDPRRRIPSGSCAQRRAPRGIGFRAARRIGDHVAQRRRKRRRIVRRRPGCRRPAGTVSGMAPARVPTTGRPWAIASANAMP